MSEHTDTNARSEEGPVEEHYYRRGDIDFCFLLNRSHHNLRVFDYRVGNYQQKRDFFDRIARSEGLKKVFTVVEKQDSKSWRSVGFSREGAIPGYFRTADAYVMSRVYTEEGDPIQGGAPKFNSPALPGKPEVTPEDPSHSMTLDVQENPDRLVKLAKDSATRALYAPFRRGVFNPDIAIQGRAGKKSFWVGAEIDTSFGHAKIDILTPPSKEVEIPILEKCLNKLIEELQAREMASIFALVPADWAISGQVYNQMGFKITARLTDHITRPDGFIGAQLWHRRIASANSPRLPSFI